jgi:hypothetical protein
MEILPVTPQDKSALITVAAAVGLLQQLLVMWAALVEKVAA